MCTSLKPEFHAERDVIVQDFGEHEIPMPCNTYGTSRLRLRTWSQSTSTRAIVHCIGAIVYEREADYLLEVAKDFDQSEVTLDLRYVNALDAYGLGRLLELDQHLARNQQRVRFANPSEHLQMLFTITKLDFCFMCACGRRLS